MKVIYGNLRKIETNQGIDYTAKFLLDYLYFEEHWKIIATKLCKEQALDATQRVT